MDDDYMSCSYGLQVEQNCPKEMAWKVNLYRGYLAVCNLDDHHLNVVNHRHCLSSHDYLSELNIHSFWMYPYYRPVSRRISRRPKKNCGLAAVDVVKPPAAGQNKIRLSRRFCHRLSRDYNDVKVFIATLLLPICALKSLMHNYFQVV